MIQVEMSKTLIDPINKSAKSKAARKSTGKQPGALLVQVDPNDPLAACVQNTASLIEVDHITLDSPALRQLKEDGVHLAVPLTLHGKLVGLFNLGPRLYEQDLSAQDRMLLMMLANQAVSASRVTEWLRNHPGDSPEREHLYQDLRIASLIQEALQPHLTPQIPGWQISIHNQPAEAVGGDFLDVFELPDHRLAVFIGDVCNKGIPSVLVMAIARSILRSTAREFVSPQRVLRLSNELLTPEIPRNMFVTCFYAVIHPASGLIQYANAGQPLPFRCRSNGVESLQATGMPLGLMHGMEYETKEIFLQPGESLLFYSDGLSEACDAHRTIAGTQRVQSWVHAACTQGKLITGVLGSLREFTGPGWQQLDDLTLLALERKLAQDEAAVPVSQAERTLAQFELPSEPGNERLAADKVIEAVNPLGLSTLQTDHLRTAVAETALNAMEHGNHYQKDQPTSIQVSLSGESLLVRVTDSGGGRPIPQQTHPDLQAKLAGLQSPRGWGLFLIRKMVDEMHIIHGESSLTVELVFSLKGEPHDV
jgi:anti-sigma regulatory factor (Ser/Thr protein kinase)